jgi:hypothetical protein
MFTYIIWSFQNEFSNEYLLAEICMNVTLSFFSIIADLILLPLEIVILIIYYIVRKRRDEQ